MAIQKLNIDEFLKKSAGNPLLDVRSPAEYGHAHIPGAYSMPIFSNEERAVIGTAYKHEGREKAVKDGLEFFSEKMKAIQPDAMKIASDFPHLSQPAFFVHCWRGGMRSGAIAWLLSLYGYRVYLLSDGYKSFRRWVLSQFEKTYRFKILGGFTGSGKTEILKEMKTRGQNIIDLERLADHKGSAFGSLGMPAQPSQEMFENLLAIELWKAGPDACIWMEDESRHIGKVHLPKTLWEGMRRSPLYFLDIPAEKRLDFIVKEYGCFSAEQLQNAVRKIEKRLGGLDAKTAIQFIEEGNLKSSFEILLKYYDKMYGHSLKIHQESGIKMHKISCSNVDTGNAAKLV